MGRMKQLYIEVEELAASLLMDLGLEPGTVAYDAVYPGVVDRLTQWVDTTFLGGAIFGGRCVECYAFVDTENSREYYAWVDKEDLE